MVLAGWGNVGKWFEISIVFPDFKEHGVGYAPGEVCRGSVAIPIRDEQGILLGYFAVQDLTYMPPDFQPNVVAFTKRA